MSNNGLSNFIEFVELFYPPSLSDFISDGHHTLWELKAQNNTIFSTYLGRITETDYWFISRMYLKPDILTLKVIDYIIKKKKEKGISPKELTIYDQEVFKSEYERRITVLKLLCNKYSDICFKTKKHFDEENDPMFDGNFMIVINTPLGCTTYHLKIEYFDEFDIPEIEHGPKYENYTTQEALYRIASIVDKEGAIYHRDMQYNSNGGYIKTR